MSTPAERAQARLIDQCDQLMGHVRLLRDYATTPDNVWLAKGELSHISETIGEIDQQLNEIKRSADLP